MAKKKAKKKSLSQRQLSTLLQSLIQKHGRVRLVSVDADWEPPCGCVCKSCRIKYDIVEQKSPDMRRRLLTKKGDCSVSYKSYGYKRWSGFIESCFMDEYYDDLDVDEKPSLSVKKTLKYLFKHDRYEELKPILIEYGPKFKRKVEL